MAKLRATSKRDVERWLLANGFERLAGSATSHVQYRHLGTGVKLALPGHGRLELSKKHFGLLVRSLERAGFTRAVIRRELMG